MFDFEDENPLFLQGGNVITIEAAREALDSDAQRPFVMFRFEAPDPADPDEEEPGIRTALLYKRADGQVGRVQPSLGLLAGHGAENPVAVLLQVLSGLLFERQPFGQEVPAEIQDFRDFFMNVLRNGLADKDLDQSLFDDGERKQG